VYHDDLFSAHTHDAQTHKHTHTFTTTFTLSLTLTLTLTLIQVRARTHTYTANMMLYLPHRLRISLLLRIFIFMYVGACSLLTDTGTRRQVELFYILLQLDECATLPPCQIFFSCSVRTALGLRACFSFCARTGFTFDSCCYDYYLIYCECMNLSHTDTHMPRHAKTLPKIYAHTHAHSHKNTYAHACTDTHAHTRTHT